MSDEIKTDNTADTPIAENKKVELEQEKLDALINKGYAKGAEKATQSVLDELGVDSLESIKEALKAKQEAEEAQKTELEKLQEQLQAERVAREELQKTAEQAKQDAHLTKLAAENGINDQDYLKFQIEQAQTQEGFNEAEFIESLKETKPFLFESAPVKKPKVDSSSNTGDIDASQRIKGAKSMQELYAIAGNS